MLKHGIGYNSTLSEMKKLIERFAKEDEKSAPFYDVIMNDNPYEALALKIEAECPNIDFLKIARLHESRDKRYWWTDLKVLITGVLGIGLFFLNTVPDGLIENLGGNADIFKGLVFITTLSMGFLVFVFWTWFWLSVGRRWMSSRRFVRDALNYLVVMKT